MNAAAVVTGLGVLSSIGIGKEEFWKANLEGRSGTDLVRGFDTSGYGSKVAAQVKDFRPEEFIPRKFVTKIDRFAQFGIASAKMAIEDSGLELSREDPRRIGVIFGSGLGGALFHEEQILQGYQKGVHRLNPLCVPRITPNAVSSQIAIAFGLTGFSLVISNACASGANAIGEALRKIQHGEADIVVCGGVEAPLTPFTFGAYDVLKVLSRRNGDPKAACRPFDRDRDGMVLAEGGAALVVEEAEHARRRGARVYAALAGYAANSGAFHMVIPDPSARDIVEAMRAALADARMEADHVDYINAHGTATTLNDAAETKGIKLVFADRARRIPVSATKSMTGHSIGGAGAIEAVACCLALERQTIPPTINFATPDPECDLDVVPNLPREARLGAVLSNSFGFGSNNACLIFRRFDQCPR